MIACGVTGSGAVEVLKSCSISPKQIQKCVSCEKEADLFCQNCGELCSQCATQVQ